MSFEIFIRCDNPNCKSKLPVPQVGGLPKGWVGVTYPHIKLDTGQTRQMVENKVYCSWKCTLTLVEGFVERLGPKQ